MKKLVSLALAVCFVFTSASAFAETSGGTHGGHHKAKTHHVKAKSMKAKSHKMKMHKAHTKAHHKVKALPSTGLGGASN